MPEGPEIRRAADQLAAAMVGKPLTEVWFAFPALKTYEPALMGETIDAFENARQGTADAFLQRADAVQP